MMPTAITIRPVSVVVVVAKTGGGNADGHQADCYEKGKCSGNLLH
jgi:hypothetical protein